MEWFPAPCGVNRLFYKKYGTYRYTCSWSISGPSRGKKISILFSTTVLKECGGDFWPLPRLTGSDTDVQVSQRIRWQNRVSSPSRGKVDAMHKGLDVSIYAKPELFPAPREVDR